jgi:hypothetical protein
MAVKLRPWLVGGVGAAILVVAAVAPRCVRLRRQPRRDEGLRDGVPRKSGADAIDLFGGLGTRGPGASLNSARAGSDQDAVAIARRDRQLTGDCAVRRPTSRSQSMVANRRGNLPRNDRVRATFASGSIVHKRLRRR